MERVGIDFLIQTGQEKIRVNLLAAGIQAIDGLQQTFDIQQEQNSWEGKDEKLLGGQRCKVFHVP